MGPPELILASQSVRRRGLIEQWGYRFRSMPPPYQDPPAPPAGDPREVAVELASKKAHSLLIEKDLDSDARVVIVGADTIVIDSTGRLLGQPQSRTEAETMLDAIAESTHEVVTGVCVTEGNRATDSCFAETARVTVGRLSPARREAHLAGGAWRGKAGGYDLWEVSNGWPVKVVGDPTTVAGLPMQCLATVLKERGIAPTSPASPAASKLRSTEDAR